MSSRPARSALSIEMSFLAIGMAEVDRDEDAAGDDVARVRVDLDHAAGRAGGWIVIVADLVDEFDDTRGAEQRILAPVHRRRPGVALDAGERDLVPLLAVRGGDDADLDAFLLEDRALLDVQLE